MPFYSVMYESIIAHARADFKYLAKKNKKYSLRDIEPSYCMNFLQTNAFFHTVLTITLKCAILYMGGEASRWKQFCIPLRDLRRFYVYIDVLRRWGVPPLRFFNLNYERRK